MGRIDRNQSRQAEPLPPLEVTKQGAAKLI
jgi:hypothetical protein